jgi:hypothetical protein
MMARPEHVIPREGTTHGGFSFGSVDGIWAKAQTYFNGTAQED